MVSPNYFSTTGIELLRGRAFVEQDDPEHPGAAIVNNSLARRYFLDEDPMGQILQHHNTAEDLPTSFGIVGIVQDVRFRGLDAEVEPALYFPARQFVDMGLLVLLRLFVGQGLRLTAVGLILGMGGAFALARVMESLLFGVSSIDATTFAWVVVVLMVVAALASYLPARRATQVDPMIALRHE